MPKVLYFTELDINNKSGGSAAAKRDYNILKESFDTEFLDIHINENKSKLKKLFDLITSDNKILFSLAESKRIKKIIKDSDAEVLVLESSLLGNYAKYAKKSGKKVITYFQNCEYKLFKACRSRLWYKAVKNIEAEVIKYSDTILVLNDRDYNDLKEIYGVDKSKVDFYPVSMNDKFVLNYNYNDEQYGLFLGSWFRPNVEAVDYIVNEIQDKINVKIKIVGKGFEQYKTDAKNVEVVGTVDDLSSYILNASFMIFPVFDGSGMKVKTCESMMYGKTIIGTNEAFMGYIMDKDHMICCNTKDEFVTTINDLDYQANKKYNPEVRNIWLENYSYDVVKTKLIDSVNKLIK